MNKANERFTSRWGMMLAMLGMAVGTGNIWRFPRITASNGGGEFLIAWIAFLFLWSIPLILLEFGLGRMTRSGPIKAFIQILGPKWAWMGAFAVFVTTAIGCYYSVVAGWTLRYTVATLTGEIPEAIPGAFWRSFTQSWWPIVTHGLVFGAAAFVVARGVRAIERVALILMPTLLLLIAILTVRALFLDGAADGLAFLFTMDWHELAKPRIWIEALTQNAWDTGAGWGLVLCYAAYLREREDTALNAFVLPISNNLVSLLAAVMVFCTVFSVVPAMMRNAQSNPESLRELDPNLFDAVQQGQTFSADLMQETIFASGNTGITFVWMPQLFKGMPGGSLLMFLFFLALAFAAFTSMMAMVEVTTRALVDAGIRRASAIKIVGLVGFLLGIPSAISMKFLDNQDWVWGVALIPTGLFFSICILAHGVRRFRVAQLNHEHSNIHIGPWWDLVIGIVVPVEAIVLVGWFLYSSWQADSDGWLAPFNPDNVANVGTVVFQFSLVLTLLLVLNRWIVSRVQLGADGDRVNDERSPS